MQRLERLAVGGLWPGPIPAPDTAHLELEGGGLILLIHYVVLLDGPRIAGLKLVGLNVEAVELFRETLRRQLAADYDRQDFAQALAHLQQHGVDDLMQMGRSFHHRGER